LTAPLTLGTGLALTVAAVTVATQAAAHPHVFVDARARIIFDDQGRISAVDNIWKFDEAFSAFATEGLDAAGNHNGKLDPAELAPLAKVNVTSLKAYDYFTYVISGSAKHPFSPPTKYHLEYANGRLTLFFTLPLKEPAAIDRSARVEIFDPEYFVAFTFVKHDPVSLEGAPAGCTAAYQPPHMLDASTMGALAAIPVEQHDLPPSLLNAAAALANVINVNCPTSAPVQPAEAQSAPPPPLPKLSPVDAARPPDAASVAAAAPDNVVLPSPAPAAQPAADVLMASGPGDGQAHDDKPKGAAAAPSPSNVQETAAAAVPVLHIKSEEELAAANDNISAAPSARASGPLNWAMVLVAIALLIGIAICAVLLQRRLRHA